MGDTTWKKHERTVARYFGVERETRGGDFGGDESCEVVAPLLPLKERINPGPYTHIIVECKYRRNLFLHDFFRDCSNRLEKSTFPPIPILKWGPYMGCWMTDFDEVWNDVRMGDADIHYFLRKYNLFYIIKAVPKYLKDWFAQAEGYVDKLEIRDKVKLGKQVNAVPTINVRGYRLHGHIMMWNMEEA